MDELTEKERQLIQEMAWVLHEELIRGIPPAYHSPKCNKCKKRVNGTLTCSKYPHWIPDEALDDCPDFEPKEEQSEN